MPIEDRARAVAELTGLIGRLSTSSSISAAELADLRGRVSDLDYITDARMIGLYHRAGQYDNVIACARAVLDKEYRRANPGPPKRLLK